VSAVDRWEGRRRINPQTGRSEVNTGGPTHNCFVAPCPQPKDNWIPDPGMPWEQKGIDGEWEYPNLRELAYPDEKTEDPKKDYKTITAVLDGAGYGPEEGNQIAMEDWRKPYVIKWQRHHDPNDSFFIKDKEYLKNLQDLVLFHRPV